MTHNQAHSSLYFASKFELLGNENNKYFHNSKYIYINNYWKQKLIIFWFPLLINEIQLIENINTNTNTNNTTIKLLFAFLGLFINIEVNSMIFNSFKLLNATSISTIDEISKIILNSLIHSYNINNLNTQLVTYDTIGTKESLIELLREYSLNCVLKLLQYDVNNNILISHLNSLVAIFLQVSVRQYVSQIVCFDTCHLNCFILHLKFLFSFSFT